MKRRRIRKVHNILECIANTQEQHLLAYIQLILLIARIHASV